MNYEEVLNSAMEIFNITIQTMMDYDLNLHEICDPQVKTVIYDPLVSSEIYWTSPPKQYHIDIFDRLVAMFLHGSHEEPNHIHFSPTWGEIT